MSHKPECDEKWEYDKDHCICNWIEKAEQRIIKLLEPLFDTAENAETRRLLIQGIALIKGENK